jgi:[acyl-carrier-protein] S-malonyltransferase
MGKVLFHAEAAAREVLTLANRAIGPGFAAMLRRGPDRVLRRTENAQPAVTAVNLAALAVLRAGGLRYEAVAGHSVGVLAAFAAAGSLEPARALELAVRRGALMGRLPGGAMASISGLGLEAVHEVLDRVRGRVGGPLVVGLVNGPGATVVSGTEDGVAEAVRELSAAGAVSATRLAVSHAFHSPMMLPALGAWRDVLAAQPLRAARVPIVCDLTGEELTEPRVLRQYLVDQLAGPVRWDLVCRRLLALGVERAVEAGDSKTLRSISRDFGGLRVVSLAQPGALGTLLDARAAAARRPEFEESAV